MLTIIDSKRYIGSILSFADKAVTYISDAMDWKTVFTGKLIREEFPEIPMPTIREAVINAFAKGLQRIDKAFTPIGVKYEFIKDVPFQIFLVVFRHVFRDGAVLPGLCFPHGQGSALQLRDKTRAQWFPHKGTLDRST